MFIINFLKSYAQSEQSADQKLAQSIQVNNIPLSLEAIKEGADVNFCYDDQPLVFLAAKTGNYILLSLLLAHEAKPDAAPLTGKYAEKTPLLSATIYNYLECVDLLLTYQANPDLIPTTGIHANLTPLWAAVRQNNPKLVKRLLDHHANTQLTPTAEKYNGLLPLSIAADQGYFECAKLLLEYQADPNATPETGSYIGKNALYFAAQKNNLALSTLLIFYKSDISPDLQDLDITDLAIQQVSEIKNTFFELQEDLADLNFSCAEKIKLFYEKFESLPDWSKEYYVNNILLPSTDDTILHVAIRTTDLDTIQNMIQYLKPYTTDLSQITNHIGGGLYPGSQVIIELEQPMQSKQALLDLLLNNAAQSSLILDQTNTLTEAFDQTDLIPYFEWLKNNPNPQQSVAVLNPDHAWQDIPSNHSLLLEDACQEIDNVLEQSMAFRI